jgi:hypothetical protein
MKESYGEGLATRTGSEPCTVVRKGEVEASAGVRVGQVLSRENHAPRREPRALRGAHAVEVGGRQYSTRRYRKACGDLARSETLRMHGRILHGNREIPRSPADQRVAGRIGKSKDTRR